MVSRVKNIVIIVCTVYTFLMDVYHNFPIRNFPSRPLFTTTPSHNFGNSLLLTDFEPISGKSYPPSTKEGGGQTVQPNDSVLLLDF